jgi:hypothetical protein
VLSADGRRLAWQADGRVHVVALADGAELATFEVGPYFRQLALSDRGDRVAVLSHDGPVVPRPGWRLKVYRVADAS